MFQANPLVIAAVQSLWDCTARIYTYTKVTDPDTHETRMEETELPGGPYPCRIDIDTAPATSDSTGPDEITQGIMLLIGSEVQVPAGARIIITPPEWDGRKPAVYKNAGVAAVYPAHQEISLVLEEEHP